jgi:DNA repair exonuclease SbcCD nuclease subunit
MNLQAFVKALDECVTANVDFIIIAGDLFDTTLPDLNLVQKTVEKIKQVKDKGIQFYLTYGSHDFAANSVSIIDILNTTGLFSKVVNAELVEEKIRLEFTVDSKTGAKITGLSGRKLGLEKKYFEILDNDNLEHEKGFKIFVFHNSIIEIRPANVSYSEGVPISCFPKGFDYYAGGHVHECLKQNIKDFGVVAFPGALFGATFTDLETTAKGEKRGFFLVDFEDKITSIRFVEVKVSEVFFQEIDAKNKTANQVAKTLEKTTDEADVKGKIALIKVTGELLAGKPSDINFNEIRQTLYNREAVVANINHYNLSTAEKMTSGQIIGENRHEIETKILSDMVKTFKIDPSIKEALKLKLEKVLTSEDGISFADSLLKSLKIEKQEGETKKDFEERVLKNTLHLLNLEAKP